MKRFYLIIFFVVTYNTSIAQVITDASSATYILPVAKVTLHLVNGIAVSGTLTAITDSTLVMSVQYKKDRVLYQHVNIDEIKSIKVKKNAFWVGMGCGAAIGCIVGYGVGYNSDNEDDAFDQTVKGTESRYFSRYHRL
jgi:hypothetical protein